MQKIKRSELHRSRAERVAELQALEIVFKEEAEKLQIPKELLDFNNDLWLLTVKHLKDVPVAEIIRLYGLKPMAELIQETLDAEKKWPDRAEHNPVYIR